MPPGGGRGFLHRFLFPGDQHYFADSTLPSYDPAATALLTERVLAFLPAL